MIAEKLSPPLFALLGAVLSSSALAQDPSEQDELNQFLELLNQQTSLATNTRLNADFVPGMLSVLTASQMQRRGFRTVWDALAVLPGVITTMNESGMRSISIRGIGEIFEPSKIKLLLNGKALNASASAITGTIFDTPVEQVERIELIRGPGSAVYGEFAFAGVLNVITQNQGEFYSAGLETGDGANFSMLKTFGDNGSDLKISLNLAGSQTEGEDIDSDADRSSASQRSYAPGPINNKRNFVSAIIDIESGNLNMLIQLQQLNRGDHFGTNNRLPPDKKQTVISETVLSATLSQSFKISDSVEGEWSLSGLHNESERNELFLGVAEAFAGSAADDDVVADSSLEEQRVEARISLQKTAAQHIFYGELTVTDIKINESEQFINLDPSTNLPSPTMNEFPGPVNESLDRSSLSLVLQDEFRIDDSLTITSGIRFDDYEDISSNVSPRIALVWRRSINHVFKTQLARAFSPPSLIETGGSRGSSIDPETNDTLEFGHIYHGSDLIIRNTAYFSQLDDLIVFQDFAPSGYYNSGSQDLYGYELEIEKSVAQWDISANLSLQDYKDDGLPGAAPWMLKLGVGYELLPLTRLQLQLNIISERDRAESDSRSEFKQQTQVDLTIRSDSFLGREGLGFSWGVRNLLDERLEHPAPADTYPDDYPYSDGAMLWAKVIYRP